MLKIILNKGQEPRSWFRTYLSVGIFWYFALHSFLLPLWPPIFSLSLQSVSANTLFTPKSGPCLPSPYPSPGWADPACPRLSVGLLCRDMRVFKNHLSFMKSFLLRMRGTPACTVSEHTASPDHNPVVLRYVCKEISFCLTLCCVSECLCRRSTCV